MNKDRLAVLALLVFILILFSYSYMPQRYLAPLSAGSCQQDLAHDGFSICPYPFGHSGAVILTVDDVSYYSDPASLSMLQDTLRAHGAYATFFVIPCHGGDGHGIGQNPQVSGLLRQSVSLGDEVGLHGYYHYPVKELRGKSYDEQLSLIGEGLILLEQDIGCSISGFRPPAFWLTQDTYLALETLGFAYCSSACIQNVFPYHPKDTFNPFIGDGMGLWEIPCYPVDNLAGICASNADERAYAMSSMLQSCSKAGTPYVVLSHLATLAAVDKISGTCWGNEVLDSFLSHAESDNVWFATLSGYLEWYGVLTGAEFGQELVNDTLVITITTDDIIEGITLDIRADEGFSTADIYRNGELLESISLENGDARVVL